MMSQIIKIPSTGQSSRSMSDIDKESIEQPNLMKRKIEYTAKELMEEDLPEALWIVPGLIPCGLSIFAGAAKSGKSWLVLGLAVSVALGRPAFGKIDLEKAGVLYLALEDNASRLQERLSTILGDELGPENLHLFLEWPNFDKQMGIEKLDKWLSDHPDVKLVIIDVYAKVKKGTKPGSWYEQDYENLGKLKSLSERHSIAMILIVHTVKNLDYEDVFSTFTGSSGTTAASDTLMLLISNRDMKHGKLKIVGRDVQQIELLLKFEKEITSWIIDGEAQEYQVSEERKNILALLANHKKPMGIREISTAINKNENAVRQLLQKLYCNRDVLRANRGMYKISDNNNNIDNNGNINHNGNN